MKTIRQGTRRAGSNLPDYSLCLRPHSLAWERKMRLLKLVLTGLFAFAMLGSSAALTAEPVKIRVGWVVPITDWALFMIEKRGLARHFDKSYVIEPVRFSSTPTVITAMANNELEIGNLGFSTLALAIQNAGMHDLRVISDLFQDGAAGYYTNEYFVHRDSAIRRVEDLKGKVIATPGAGGAIDIAMRAMLRRHGLEDKRDYSMTEAPLAAARAMLAEKKVDLVPGVPPFSLDPEMRKVGRVLFTQKEALGTTQMIILTARKSFLDKNRAVMVDFLEDNLRIARWYLDPANHDEAVQIAARLTKQPPERFASWLFTHGDYYRDPNMLPNLQVLQANIDVQRELGFLKEAIDIENYVELGIIKEAAQRLN
jgi:sulfonate transport system substrate-binding protein